MKKDLYIYLTLAVLVLAVGGVTLAAFSDKGSVLGSTFSVGSADIRLLNDVSGGVLEENLSEELVGPSFENISSLWSAEYLVKVYNNSSSVVNLTSNANYETVNDPEDLRQIIYVELYEWHDTNNDGDVDVGELGASLGKKTIVKWKTEGYDLGQLQAGEIKGLSLRFSTDTVSDTKQGASALFDFEFNSVGM